MKITEEEKGLIEFFRKLESKKCKDDILLCADSMFRAQEATKAEYGLVGRDAPLFNGVNALTA
jgi:hypothetical protein